MIEDRGALLAAALCAVLDLVLILVMQNTVREPLLMLMSAYTSSAWVEAGFVVVVVVLALFVLSHIYRTSKPVSAYLAWSVLDRLVPTAGFLAGPVPAPALASGRTASRPPSEPSADRTETAPDAEQTTISDRGAAAATPPATPRPAEEITVRAPEAEPERTAASEKTVVSERTVVAPKQANTTEDQR